MELLESESARPRQARYQAALRPDMKCEIHSKALSNVIPNPHYRLHPRREGTSGAKPFCCVLLSTLEKAIPGLPAIQKLMTTRAFLTTSVDYKLLSCASMPWN